MKKWEYNIETTELDKTIRLNDFGKEGWELISVVAIPDADSQDYKFFFKREVSKWN